MSDSIQYHVKRLWSEQLEAGMERPGLSVSDVISHCQTAFSENISKSVSSSLIVFDEFLSYLISLANISEFKIMNNLPAVENRNKAHISLLSCLISQAIAIRHLTLCGLDIPAKQILRSFAEYIDVSILLSLNPDLVNEFVEAEEFDGANAFWHKYVSKGKARRSFWSKIAELADNSELNQWKSWKKEEDTVLSISSHPSYFASVMSYVPNLKNGGPDQYWPAYLGGVAGAGASRTLRYCTFLMYEYIVFCKDLNEGIDQKENLRIDELLKEFRLHVEVGFKVLPKLISLLWAEREGE